MPEYPAAYNLTNAVNERAVDAIIHEVFFGMPLWLARGPFFDGLPVPRYFSDEGASFSLLHEVMPEAAIKLSMTPGTGVTVVELEVGDLSVEVRQSGSRAAPLIALACVEAYLMQSRGMTRDQAVEWIFEAIGDQAGSAPPSHPPALPQRAPIEA